MCTTFVAKLVLGLINTLIFIVGVVMFAIGLLIHTQPAFSQTALSTVLDKLKSTASTAGVDINTDEFSAADVAYSFTIAIIVVGLFLAAVSVLGLIGVKYSLKPVLIVYFIVTLVLFLGQVAVVLVAVIDRDVFDDQVKPRLDDTLDDHFVGIGGNDATSQIWNGIMIHLECCGLDDFGDFNDSTSWNRTSRDGGGEMKTPVACCKNITTESQCARDPTPNNSNYKTGCYTKIWDYLLSNSGIVIGIAVGVLGSQLVILLLTIILMNSMNTVGVV
ncbi:tetraspanin-1-like [Littorina saxatilis]|uniref:Tetraspanin n=1 Tax=Littorina saxatilis TaxID=31220 RepID=A0AAN9BR45_9CAEN